MVSDDPMAFKTELFSQEQIRNYVQVWEKSREDGPGENYQTETVAHEDEVCQENY